MIILFAATSLVSCLKDDDDKSTYYSDTALSMFQINNIIVTKTTKSSQGTDSTYKVQQSAALYDFVIDQEKHEVYNIDSLTRVSLQGSNRCLTAPTAPRYSSM